MLTQNILKPHPGSRKKKNIYGRGDSSGHGSFSGRGGKGQTARSGGKRRPGFEGGQTPLIRRMPKLKGFKNPKRIMYQTINVSALNCFDDGSTIDLVQLYEADLLSRKDRPIKILGDGTLGKKLAVKVDACSKSAKKKIEEKGGTLLLPQVKTVLELKKN